MAVIRPFLIAGGAIVIAGAVLGVALGDARFALSSAIVGAGALLLGTWAWRRPTPAPAREWVALGLIAAGLLVAGQVVPAILFLVVAFLLAVGSSRLVMRRISPSEFERVGPYEVMRGAETVVAEFEAAGFHRVGGYRGRIPVYRKVITATVLEGTSDDSFAVVTDRVWEVVSRFGGRWLVTTSAGLAPLPGHILRQALAGARPADLLEAHRGAVELLARRGLEADRLVGEAALDAARALEEDAARFISSAPLKRFVAIEARRGSEDPPLGDDGRSSRRIDVWLDSQDAA
jgi:hypothetical protein